MTDQSAAINKLCSFALKTAIGYVPIVGPAISSGIGELEKHFADENARQITAGIVDRLKRDKSNLILVDDKNVHTVASDSLLENISLGDWLTKYSQYQDGQFRADFNTSDIMLALNLRLIQESHYEPTLDECERLRVYQGLYDVVCQLESEVWIENDMRADAYASISRYLRKENDYKSSIYFSIKCIDEASTQQLKLAYFILEYIPAWIGSIALLVNQMQAQDQQMQVLENATAVLRRTIESIQAHSKTGNDGSVKDAKRETTFTHQNVAVFSNSKRLQVCTLVAYLTVLLRDIPHYFGVLVDVSDTFYTAYDNLTTTEAEYAVDLIRSTRDYYDELFRIQAS